MDFELTYWGLFVGCLLSATVIPFASEALFIGVLYSGADPFFTLLVATSGNFIGSLITYWMGYLANFNRFGGLFGLTNEKVYKSKSFVDKYGYWAALLTWIPIIGDPITLALGFFRVKASFILPLILIVKWARYYVLYQVIF